MLPSRIFMHVFPEGAGIVGPAVTAGKARTSRTTIRPAGTTIRPGSVAALADAARDGVAPARETRMSGGAHPLGDHAMCRSSVIVLVIAACSATSAFAGERMHYLDLINRAHDRLVSVSATPAGGTAWEELLQGEPLAGGGGAVTVQVAGDQCLHDVRVEFANGRRALYPAVDLCRHRGLRIQPLPAARQASTAVAARGEAEAAGGVPPAE
jgi:hypothetical protein